MILLLVLAAGAYYDVREHRIPNWWVVTALFSGVILCMLESGEPVGGALFLKEGILFLVRMTIVCGAFFLFFLCRMIGAGDIKLTALMCGYLGLKAGAAAVGCGFLIGAAWSLFKMMVRGTFMQRLSCLLAYIRRVYHTKEIVAYYQPERDGNDPIIPLGVCLFLGTAVYMIWQICGNW